MPASPERALDRMQLGPSPDTFPIEFGGIREDVHRPVGRRPQISLSRRVSAHLQQRRAVLGGLDVPLGIDRQPGFTIGAQDVAG